MRVLWFHVRNSPIRLAIPFLVAIDLAVIFLRNRHWIGVWPETGAAAQVPAYLLGVVGAGAAAWASTAPARHGLKEQLNAARIHPVIVEAYRLGATVVVLLIPYLVGHAVAFVMTARTFPPGMHLWLGYFLLGLFVILIAVALGWTCGRLFGPVFAALTAALGFLFLTALLDRWTGFVVVSGRPEVAVEPLPLMLRIGSVIVLLLALVLLFTSAKTRPPSWKSLTPVPASLLLVMVMLTTNPVADRDEPGNKVICIEGRTDLCIWPEHEKYVPQLQKLNERINLLPDIFVPPPRINQVGIKKTRYIGPDGKEHIGYEMGPPIFYILEGSPWSYAGDIAQAIAASTFGYRNFESCNWQTVSSSDQKRLWAVGAWLEAYLVGQENPDYQTDAPDEMQNAWAKGRSITRRSSLQEQFRWAEEEAGDLLGRYCHQRG